MSHTGKPKNRRQMGRVPITLLLCREVDGERHIETFLCEIKHNPPKRQLRVLLF